MNAARRAVLRTTFLVGCLLAAGVPAVAQTAQTRQVMREKLELSEILLGGLVTSNWTSLQRNTQSLQAVINKPGWQVLESPEYVRQTAAFLKSISALLDAADARDQRVALSAYNGLVASCVECHRYVARARVASAPGGSGPIDRSRGRR